MIRKRSRQPEDKAPVQTAQDRRILRNILYGFLAIMLFSVCAACAAYMWLTSDHGRQWLRDMIETRVSSETMQLTIGEISELSLRGVRVDHIKLTEQDEVLTDIASAYLAINPYALLVKRLHIIEISAPDIYFHRLPQNDENAPQEPASFPDINALSIPNMQIDKLDAHIRFSGQENETLSIKGYMNLDPNRLMNNHVELHVKNQAEKELIDIRFLPHKTNPQLFLRVDDPESFLLRRFAEMEDAPAIDIVWQGAMQATNTWKGELRFSLPDIVSGDLAVNLDDLFKAPILTFKGIVSPIVLTDNALQLDGTLSGQGLTLKAFLDQWIQDDLVILKPVLELKAQPAVQFIVHQGYQWDLQGRIDAITRDEQSVSAYSDQLQLAARGRLGRTRLTVANMTLGNELWQAAFGGYYHLLKSYVSGEAIVTLQDQGLQNILGGLPIAKTDINWRSDKGLQLTEGVLDIGKIQGEFKGVIDPDQVLSFYLGAKATDITPYFNGQALLTIAANGPLDNPEIKAELNSDQIILESGTEIQAVKALVEGDLTQNKIALGAALEDGEYQVTTSFAAKDAQYIFSPTHILLPLGRIDGKIAIEQKDSIHVQADLKGRVEEQTVSFVTDIQVDTPETGLVVLFNHLAIEWKKLKLRLQKPARIIQQNEAVQIEPLLFDVNGGRLSAEALYSPDKIDATVKATSFPLTATSMPLESGSIDGSMTLTGTQAAPELQADLTLKNLVPQEADLQGERVSLSGTVKGRFAQDIMAVQAVLQGMRGVNLNSELTVPMKLIPFDLKEDAPLKGHAKGQVDLMALIALAMLDGHELHGRGDVDINITGTVSNPNVAGAVKIINARYENAVYGVVLNDLNMDLGVSVSEAVIRRFSARDTRDGRLTGEGKIGLKPLDNPNIDLTIRSQRMQVLNSPSLAANATSNIFIKGRVDQLVISGDVYIHDAEVFVDDIAGSGDPYRDYTIIEKNLPTAKGINGSSYRVVRAEESDPIRLDIQVDAPNAIFVRGPGLDSEWSAKLSVRGTTDKPRLNGTLSVLRGSYQFVDLLVNLKPKSQVIFSGDASNPELALSGIIPGRSMNATLSVTGNIEKPVVELTSDQGLPSDEILSRVLFGRSASGLSPAQAVQVARILARLSGQGGAGFDPIGVMRNALGVDTLGVNMGDEDGAGPTVSVGKYISDDIYVSVEQGSTPNSSAVRSEIRLTDQLQVETQNSTEDNKIGLQWRWDY